MHQPAGCEVLPALWEIASDLIARRAKPGGLAVSEFSPSIFNPAPAPAMTPSENQLLARFLPTAIRRIPPVGRINRPARVAFIGLLTAGLLPLLQLRTRIRRLMIVDQQQLELVCRMLRQLPQPIQIDQALFNAGKMPAAPVLRWLDDLFTLGAIITLFFSLAMTQWSTDAITRYFFYPPSIDDPAAIASLVLLCVAYVICHFQINHHLAQTRKFVEAFNHAAGDRVQSLQLPARVWGFRLIHLMLAIALILLGKLWAFPMMVAWGALQTMMLDHQRRFRVELADRLVQLSGSAPVIQNPDLCRNEKCGYPIPDDARFCPRCGYDVPVRAR